MSADERIEALRKDLDDARDDYAGAQDDLSECRGNLEDAQQEIEALTMVIRDAGDMAYDLHRELSR